MRIGVILAVERQNIVGTPVAAIGKSIVLHDFHHVERHKGRNGGRGEGAGHKTVAASERNNGVQPVLVVKAEGTGGAACRRHTILHGFHHRVHFLRRLSPDVNQKVGKHHFFVPGAQRFQKGFHGFQSVLQIAGNLGD